MFGSKPTENVQSPRERGDHPELNTTKLLNDKGIKQYQSLIGSIQWAVSIERWDTQIAVMTLSSFRAQPKQGHLDQAKQLYSFLRNFQHFKIKFLTDEPDFSTVLKTSDFTKWRDTTYGHHDDDLKADASPPLGKRVILSHYYNASLMHDVLNGKAVTGVLYFYNKTPIDWFCKKQATAETATYGSKFIACCTCLEQLMNHQNYLRYFGVEVYKFSYTWGDNESQVLSSVFPHLRLHK